MKNGIVIRGTTVERRQDKMQKRLFIDVTNILHEIGVPAHMLGHDYLRDAIILVFQSPKRLRRITIEVYPQVARMYGTSISSVEKSMRNAIETVWVRGNQELIYQMFGNTIDIRKTKPANKEFIAMVVDMLRISYM